MDSSLFAKSLFLSPFLKRIERWPAPSAASTIPSEWIPVALELQIHSSSLSALDSTLYPLDPLSDNPVQRVL
jgi:hypothetical protein